MDESPASVQNGRENQDTKSACNMQALFYCLLRLMRYADVWGVAVQAIVLRNTRLCEMRFIRCVPVKCKTAIIYALFFVHSSACPLSLAVLRLGLVSGCVLKHSRLGRRVWCRSSRLPGGCVLPPV